MMVCEVKLYRVEERRIGISCELRPAFTGGDPATICDWCGVLFLERPAECR
jgi:hypothetical protein